MALTERDLSDRMQALALANKLQCGHQDVNIAIRHNHTYSHVSMNEIADAGGNLRQHEQCVREIMHAMRGEILKAIRKASGAYRTLALGDV